MQSYVIMRALIILDNACVRARCEWCPHPPHPSIEAMAPSLISAKARVINYSSGNADAASCLPLLNALVGTSLGLKHTKLVDHQQARLLG